MLPRCRWPVERPFALPPVEARQMPAGNHRPHNAIAIDVQPARREPMNWRVWIVPWQFVDFCKRSRRGIWSGVQSNDCTRESQHRSPDRPVHWTHGDAVESGVDPLVFGGIDGLIGLYILVPLHQTWDCGRWLGCAKWLHLPNTAKAQEPYRRRSMASAGHGLAR